MPRLHVRKGFALPMAILIIAVLTAALAAGLTATRTEFTTNAAERGQSRAYVLAETGLQQFLMLRSTTKSDGTPWCDHCALPPASDPALADSEWTRVNLNGGYANVVAVRIGTVTDSTTPVTYFIRSTGVDTSVKLNGAALSTNAQHTVGVYSQWVRTTMKVTAAWVSLSGLIKNGSGLISGIDQCGQAASVAGVQVDSGDLVIKGGSFNPQGSPPVDTSKTFSQLKASMTLDWAGILGGSIPADVTIPGGTFPTSTQFADTNYWPVIRVHTNNYSLPNAGRGIIIADSNFVISGSNMWSGIVLVGGQLTSNGNNTTYGATLSGLNYLTGGNPPPGYISDDATANGTKQYIYDSCSVSKATTAMRHYAVMANTWIDNLAAW